jgi:two-component system, chemotaxis family, protein-glutamate methylesterase/glutaminase
VSKIRVLVVDDVVVVRKLLGDVLGREPDIEVVGAAANGKIALDKVRQTAPDVVLLDIEMPVMDGLEALSRLRETHPSLPVIMFSTLTERGATMTLEALSRGASDYVTKPSQTGSLEASLECVRRELLPRIRALCASKAAPAAPLVVGSGGRRPPRRSSIEIVVIGVSTGGPAALGQLVPALGDALGVPVLIVQHMPAMFTRMLAQRLDAVSPLRIEEGYDGAPIEAGRAYLAPGGRHMEVRRNGARIEVVVGDGPEENSCRPSVDVLFRSVAKVYGGSALAVVLTGMGEDGLRGCERISECGGSVVVQDEASSVVWGMPGAVARAGLTEEVLPLDEIGAVVARKVRAGRPRAAAPSAPARVALDASGYEELRKLLLGRCGMVLDASKNYLIDMRLDPLVRREGLAGLPDLVQKLRADPHGSLAERVVEAMMVHETSFFRDLHPFETLREVVIPALMRARAATKRLAIWCAAGASGQEPYSVAMTLLHYFPELAQWDVQIHASDLSLPMLEVTRAGRYARIEVNRGVPRALLQEFFRPEGDDWIVRDDLRKLVRTFPINLIEAWPALPRMDVIFLRNVLIYFEVAQKRSVLERVASVLRPDGALFLGATETMLQIADGFESIRRGKSVYYRPCS